MQQWSRCLWGHVPWLRFTRPTTHEQQEQAITKSRASRSYGTGSTTHTTIPLLDPCTQRPRWGKRRTGVGGGLTSTKPYPEASAPRGEDEVGRLRGVTPRLDLSLDRLHLIGDHGCGHLPNNRHTCGVGEEDGGAGAAAARLTRPTQCTPNTHPTITSITATVLVPPAPAPTILPPFHSPPPIHRPALTW